MNISDERVALLFAIDCLKGQLATLEDDDWSNTSSSGSAMTSQDGAQFWGVPLFAKFTLPCAVCGGKIDRGDPFIYRGSDRLTAHARCGHDDGGQRR